MRTIEVKELVNEVLEALPKPHTEDAIRDVFASIEGSPEWRKDCLRKIGDGLDNSHNRLWNMQNGYAMCSRTGLEVIGSHLAQLDETALDELRSKLCIGLHWNVEVTDGAMVVPQHVFQAFCSALPVAYGRLEFREWAPFAALILEAAYEANMWAAILNSRA